MSVTQTPGQHYVNMSISALGEIRTNICFSYEHCGISPTQYNATLTLPNFKFTQLFKLKHITMSMEQRVVHISIPYACSERFLWKLVSAM